MDCCFAVVHSTSWGLPSFCQRDVKEALKPSLSACCLFHACGLPVMFYIYSCFSFSWLSLLPCWVHTNHVCSYHTDLFLYICHIYSCLALLFFFFWPSVFVSYYGSVYFVNSYLTSTSLSSLHNVIPRFFLLDFQQNGVLPSTHMKGVILYSPCMIACGQSSVLCAWKRKTIILFMKHGR